MWHSLLEVKHGLMDIERVSKMPTMILVAQGAAAIIQESETVVKKEKEPGGDSEYEEIEVEDSPGYASTAVPGEDDSESESGC